MRIIVGRVVKLSDEFEWDDKIQLLNLEKVNKLQFIFQLHDIWSKEEVMKVITDWFNDDTKYVTLEERDKIKKIFDKMENRK